MFCDNLLTFFGVKKLQVGFGSGPSPSFINVFVNNGDMWLVQDTELRINNFQFTLRFFHFQIRFALHRQVDVADPLLGKGHRCTSGTSIQVWSVSVQLFDEPDSIGFASPIQHHISPGTQKAQPTVSRGLGIGCDDRNTRLHHVAPIFDPFGISLADHKHDR